MDVAAKTGTTSDDKDRWFSAFTPYYVGSVWFGYDTPAYINVPSNPGTKMWHDVMAEIHKGLAPATFEMPNGIVTAEVCRDSGLLATDACRQDKRGSRVTTAIFNSKNGTLPREKCNVHEFVEVCPETFQLPNPVCRHLCGTVTISRINKHYNGTQTGYGADHDYETPTTYCTLPEHYCPVDESGNFVTTGLEGRKRAEDEINSINENIDSIFNNTPSVEQTVEPAHEQESIVNESQPSNVSLSSNTSTTSSSSTTTTNNSSSNKKNDDNSTGRTSTYWWER
jgi:penicillin-binding protein 1A